MDNISTEEQSKPPQLYHNNRFMSATVSAALPGKSIVMDWGYGRNCAKVLDDTLQLI
jgi:HAE1 family hydrophobic/amphiphilic exporter-1/multidrug efflux pump